LGLKEKADQNISVDVEYRFEIILNIVHRLSDGTEERCFYRHSGSEKGTEQADCSL
jgi:hypothetical protein